MQPERRKRRSGNPFLALTYWLEAAARRWEMSGLLLADAHGHVIATSLSPRHAQEVATVAPLVAQGEGWPSFTSLVVRELPTVGGTLLLCGVGQTETPGAGAALEQVAVGVRRIIRQLLGGVWAPL